MATATFTMYAYLSGGSTPDPAQFRATLTAIRAALTALGFERTADTGQVDPETVTYVSATAVIGYEIWAFTDELQATAPVVFKLEYARTTGTFASGLMIYVTVGKGSDGAGTITEVLCPRGLAGSGPTLGGDNTTQVPGYASSGDGSMLALAASPDQGTASAAPLFIIDRSRDHTGAPSPDGVVLATNGNGATGSTSTMTPTNTVAAMSAALQPNRLCAAAYASTETAEGPIPVLLPARVRGGFLGTGRGFANGVVAPVFPWAVYPPGVSPWQVLAGVSFAGSDDPGGVFTVHIAGQDRTYRSFPITGACHGWGLALDSSAFTSSTVTGSNLLGLAVLWE